MNLLKMIFFLVIYIHCFACFWWYLIREDKVWLLPKYQSQPDMYALYYDSVQTQYFTSLYVAVQMLNGVDQQPRNSFQTIIAAFGIFFGAVINANIFGELTVIMASLDKQEKEFQVRLTQNNTAMINLRLPHGIQQNVRDAMVMQEKTFHS